MFRGGLVTYASELKSTLARVDAQWIAENGVINSITAAQMAMGCRKVCDADLGMACTGVAGPDPQDGEQAGTVFIAVVYRGPRSLNVSNLRVRARRFGAAQWSVSSIWDVRLFSVRKAEDAHLKQEVKNSAVWGMFHEGDALSWMNHLGGDTHEINSVA